MSVKTPLIGYEETVVHSITIEMDGGIFVKTASYDTDSEGVKTSESRYHRTVLRPGDDIDKLTHLMKADPNGAKAAAAIVSDARVKQVASQMWTPEILADERERVTRLKTDEEASKPLRAN